MSQNYKITAVSPKTKEWEGKFGPMVDYYVKFAGIDAPVVVTKKPDSRPPAVDEELYGQLDMGNKFGPKFKAESKPFGGGGGSYSGGGGGSKPSYQPKDEKDIHAQFAIREANFQVCNGIITEDKLEETANDFFDMIERVKTHNEAQPALPLDVPTVSEADDKAVDLDAVDKVFGQMNQDLTGEEIPF